MEAVCRLFRGPLGPRSAQTGGRPMSELNGRWRYTRGVMAMGLLAFGCGAGVADEMSAVPEIRPGVLAGSLPRAALPDSVSLLRPPPPRGSPAEALDQQIARENLALRDTPRWKLSGMD